VVTERRLHNLDHHLGLQTSRFVGQSHYGEGVRCPRN